MFQHPVWFSHASPGENALTQRDEAIA